MKKAILFTIKMTITVSCLVPSNANSQNIFPAPGPGNVGIGTLTPVNLLEVVGGDINVSTSSRAYLIAGQRILWHDGNTNNIFVGVNAGNSTMTGTENTLLGNGAGQGINGASYNTFLGKNAGNNNGAGGNNVFVGANAGLLNHDGIYNTFVGSNSGSGGYKSLRNTFLGYNSGRFQDAGSNNCFLGMNSGYQSTVGHDNCYLGYESGYSGLTNRENIAIGSGAGYNNVADNNIFLGHEAGHGNTSGVENTFIGYQSGKGNATGSYNTVTGYQAGGQGASSYSYNTFYGGRAGQSTTPGGQLNTYIGYNTGPSNTIGTLNVFVGAGAGSNNISGTHCTMVGYLSGMSNTTAWYNTFLGYHAGRFNTTGQHNLFTGHQSGQNTTTGSYNVLLGNNAGVSNTTGAGNTAIGYQTGDSYATGSYNTFLGYQADANGNYTNATAIGRGAVVTAANRMQFGNASVTGCYNTSGLWTSSDGRFKFNVNEDVSGLDFIMRLRPVTYQMNTQELDAFLREQMPQPLDTTGLGLPQDIADFAPSTSMVHAGFIAQEVEEAAMQSGFVTSLVSVPEHDNDSYALSYAQFVVPLVKAVQEQQDTIEGLTGRINLLEGSLAQMQGLLEQCCATGANMRLDESGQVEVRTTVVELGSADGAILYQNRPNPFTEETLIGFYLPRSVKVATMVFYDNAGQVIKEVILSDRGNASVTIQPKGLAAGVYTYSLIVDGKTIETRRMVKGN